MTDRNKDKRVLRNKDKGLVLILDDEPFFHEKLKEKLENYSCYETQIYKSNDLRTALSGQRKKYCGAIIWAGALTEEVVSGVEENIKFLLTYDNIIPIAVVLTASEKEEKTKKYRKVISEAFMHGRGADRGAGMIIDYNDIGAADAANRINYLFKISPVSLRKRRICE